MWQILRRPVTRMSWKGEELCQGHWQAGHGEEEQCRRKSTQLKKDLTWRRRLDRDSCTVLDEEGTLWRGRARAVSPVTLQDVYSHAFSS
ncbi:uncharacterized protein UHOD_12093 [Ustilago sp. UG-2017b]|nr:uncharacterized protein UHOD_12093 [Ustilago sp. UG-2017b]